MAVSFYNTKTKSWQSEPTDSSVKIVNTDSASSSTSSSKSTRSSSRGKDTPNTPTTQYVEESTGQGVSIAPELAEKDPTIVTREQYVRQAQDPYEESYRQGLGKKAYPPSYSRQYVEEKTGQGVSIAPELAKQDTNIVTRAEYEKAQDTRLSGMVSPKPSGATSTYAGTYGEAAGMSIGTVVVKDVYGKNPKRVPVNQIKESRLGGTSYKGRQLFKSGEGEYTTVAGGSGGLALLAPSGKLKAGASAIFKYGKPAAAKAGQAAKVTAKAAKTAATKAKTVYQTTQKTRMGRFLKDIGLVTAEGIVVTEVGKGITKGTAPADQKEVTKMAGFDDIIGAGFAAEKQALSQEVWYKSIGFEISPFFSTRKDVYEKTVREELQKQGLTGEQLETGVAAAIRQRKGISITEAAANINIARASEKIGRREVTKVLEGSVGKIIPKNKAFSSMFKLTAPSIAQAGAVEGFAQEITQQKSREQETDIKGAVIMGGVGAATAGIIGGTIAGTAATRPGVSKTIEYATYITDPFEKPGDIAQDISEAVVKKVTKKAPPTPTITETLPADAFFSIGTSGKKSGGGKKSSVLQAGTVVGTPAQTPTKTPTKTPAPRVPTIIGTPIGKGTFVPTDTNIPIPPNDPTPTPVTPTKSNIFENIFNTETPVNVPTPIPINVGIGVPTATPIPRVPPPLPVQFPAASGGAGIAIGKRKKSVNELQAGLNYLNKVLGNKPQRRKSVKPKKMSKRKKKKR